MSLRFDFNNGIIVDYLIIISNNEEHLEHLRLIIERMRKSHLKVKPSKYHLFQKEVSYLGHVITKGTICPLEKK